MLSRKSDSAEREITLQALVVSITKLENGVTGGLNDGQYKTSSKSQKRNYSFGKNFTHRKPFKNELQILYRIRNDLYNAVKYVGG